MLCQVTTVSMDLQLQHQLTARQVMHVDWVNTVLKGLQRELDAPLVWFPLFTTSYWYTNFLQQWIKRSTSLLDQWPSVNFRMNVAYF